MNSKSNPQNPLPNGIRSESLLSRIDPFRSSRANSATQPPPNGNSSWYSCLFSRLICDSNLSASHKNLLSSEFDKVSLSTLMRQKGPLRNPAGSETLVANTQPLPSKQSILAIFPDEPLDAESFTGVTVVEFQMLGIPFRPLPANRIASWAPCFPIEITSVDQLAKKFNTVRSMVGGGVRIGCAICPTSVYEDVRSLADCGVDYICLLMDVFPELSANARLELGSNRTHLDLAMRGLRDSGTSAKLHVASNTVTSIELFEQIQSGVASVCVDAFLAERRPPATATTRDSFGSVLSYVATPVSPFAWVSSSLNGLLQDLNDWHQFFGRV